MAPAYSTLILRGKAGTLQTPSKTFQSCHDKWMAPFSRYCQSGHCAFGIKNPIGGEAGSSNPYSHATPQGSAGIAFPGRGGTRSDVQFLKRATPGGVSKTPA